MSAQLQLFEARGGSDRWAVRVSKRARRLSVRVYPGGRVEVVVPPGASPAMIQRFVGTHRQWIDRRVEDLSGHGARAADLRPATIQLTAVDRQIAVHYQETSASVARLRTLSDADALLVTGPTRDERAVAEALRQWLMTVGHAALGARLSQLADECGFSYSRLQVRRQRTRWGSCSVGGTISLNVCLLFLEPAVVRYLMVHELSHTRHMNHSRRFWALVETHEPQYRTLDRQLLRGWQQVPGWVFL